LNSKRLQQTIARPAGIAGRGYWSGREVNVEFRPAPANTGIVFIRHDISDVARIPATIDYRIDSSRRTTIEADGMRIDMVEHLLSALAGLQIDNCEIWVDGSEMPADDGSCIAAATALRSAGTVQQNAARQQLRVWAPCRVGDDANWIEARPTRDAGLSVRFQLNYGLGSAIGQQEYALSITPTTFIENIAPARTFVLEDEARQFQQQGFGQSMSYEDILVFGADGPIQNKLRFVDECVRHKILDLVGDIALIGVDINAHIVAHRSGHRLNAALVEALLEQQAQKPIKVSA
jgi:UDP-3-O-acyl N-acetylglucosamine deacetylase